MSLEDDLFALEEKFWPGDADFYRAHLDTQCVVAFTECRAPWRKSRSPA
jgi:hypothetical protein